MCLIGVATDQSQKIKSELKIKGQLDFWFSYWSIEKPKIAGFEATIKTLKNYLDLDEIWKFWN